MTVDLKGRAKIGCGLGPNEVEVINGAIRVLVVARGSRMEGYGSAQIKKGIASKGEAVVIAGALRVKI